MEVAYAMKGRGAGEVKGESSHGHHMSSADTNFHFVRIIHHPPWQNGTMASPTAEREAPWRWHTRWDRASSRRVGRTAMFRATSHKIPGAIAAGIAPTRPVPPNFLAGSKLKHLHRWQQRYS